MSVAILREFLRSKGFENGCLRMAPIQRLVGNCFISGYHTRDQPLDTLHDVVYVDASPP